MKKLLMIACGAVCILCIASFVNTGLNPKPGEDETVIAMRNIGHRLLLQGADATSTLLPVKKLAGNSYQLQFRQPLVFIADSLVQTIHSQLGLARLGNRYLVKITNPTGEVVYTYNVTGTLAQSNIPCLGRDQPAAQYNITIVLGAPGLWAGLLQPYLLAAAGLALALTALAVTGFKRKPVKLASAAPPAAHSVNIGLYQFFTASGILQYNHTNIPLTAKEIKLLTVFATRQNVIIERQELVKNIWEDEGLVVGGRSLDVFVSKLRKKLINDPTVNIVNAHGLGYKLQTGVDML